MNYRHIYHAGNVSDVIKHVVLALILEHLRAKPTPFCVLDAHAGIGRYDLASEAAGKTREFQEGIGRLIEAPAPPPALMTYLAAVRALNPEPGPLRWYPGSPRLTRALMRRDDRLVLVELHPEDVRTLRREFIGDDQVAVHHMDGYQALKAHLPPIRRRGLVLLDPPFEVPDEFDRLVAGLRTGWQRWPTGIYALWYPIKERAAVWRFHEALTHAGIPKILMVEMTVRAEERWDRLNGCGLIVVNPPWQLDRTLSGVLPDLHKILGTTGGGDRVEWLVPDSGA